MRKLFYSAIAALALSSCRKDPPSIPDPNFAPAVSAVPSEFKQKVLIEQFTKSTSGQCPKAHLILDSLMAFNPDRVYGVSIHTGDIMQDTNLLTSNGKIYHDSLFNPTGNYPVGMVNRHLTSLGDIAPSNWPARVLSNLSHSPSCGVALEAERVVGNTLTLTVHVGFSHQMFGQYNIHVYVVEGLVQTNDSAYLQINDFSINGNSPDSLWPTLYAQDDTIMNYPHKNVLRQVVTDVEGDMIPETAMVPGGKYVVNYEIDLNTVNINTSYILVFVDKHATTLSGHWIENVQTVSFGASKDWN